MRFSAFFIDLDNTVYPNDSGMWDAIKNRINLFMQEILNIPQDTIPTLRKRYLKEYGTTLKGLQANYNIEEADYLKFVHDLKLEDYIQPNPELGKILDSFPQKKYIFTSSDRPHAERVLKYLQLDQYFDQIIDLHTTAPYCKPQLDAYKIALKTVGIENAESCVMMDDIPANVKSAQETGFYGILIGAPTDNHFIPDAQLDTLADLHKLQGELTR